MREILAYIAGIIDGEGCIAIHRSSGGYFQGRVHINMTDKEVIDLIQSIYPAWMNSYQPRKGKLQWKWVITCKRAAKFLEDIYEFLRIKKNQATLVLELESRKHYMGHGELSKKECKYREELYKKLKELHK